MIKEIKIKCVDSRSISIHKYYIEIYDCNNKLIYSNDTKCDGFIYFGPQNFGLYKIVVYDSKRVSCLKCVNFFVNSSNISDLIIRLNDKYNIRRLITINLTDQNYKGLKIMKGEITLCQNNT